MKRRLLLGLSLLAALAAAGCGVPSDEHERVVAERDSALAETSSVRASIRQLEEALSGAEARTRKLEGELAQSLKELEQRATRVEGLERELGQEKERGERLQGELAQVRGELGKALEGVSQGNAQVVSLKGDLARADVRLSALQEELTKATARETELKEALAAVRAGSYVFAEAGGPVSSDDRKLSIAVPPKALTSDKALSVRSLTKEEAPAHPFGGQWVGPVYELGPDGLAFEQPVTVTLSLAKAEVPIDEQGRMVLPIPWTRSTKGGWVPLEKADLSYSADGALTVKTEVMHFSSMALSGGIGLAIVLPGPVGPLPVGSSFTALAGLLWESPSLPIFEASGPLLPTEYPLRVRIGYSADEEVVTTSESTVELTDTMVGPIQVFEDQHLFLCFKPGTGWYRARFEVATVWSHLALAGMFGGLVDPKDVFSNYTVWFKNPATCVQAVPGAGAAAAPGPSQTLAAPPEAPGPSQASPAPGPSQTPPPGPSCDEGYVRENDACRLAPGTLLLAVDLSPAYPRGNVIPLIRIDGGYVSGQDDGCAADHYHAAPPGIRIDGVGPFPDPAPSTCGFGFARGYATPR